VLLRGSVKAGEYVLWLASGRRTSPYIKQHTKAAQCCLMMPICFA
jgi:hypothetical protein